MAPSPKGNDRRRAPFRAGSAASRRADRRGEPGGAEWLWGRHAVEAALANPARMGLQRLLQAPDRGLRLPAHARDRGLSPEVASPQEIGRMLPPGAVHQGLALLADPVETVSVEALAEPAEGVLVVLDQVSDPQNVGAVMRSAAAFGARGLILQDRHAPPLSGALAKAAAGALERVSCARAVNLSRALEALAERGWRTIGLAGDAEQLLDGVLDGGPTALVLGSEGDGLRRLVSEHCDVLARIAMPGGFESLNVAAAAAVALYAATAGRISRP